MKHSTRTVLVANPKGGCGKTTLAINLASGLAYQHEKVLLTDLDRQQSALRWLSLRPAELPTISQVDTQQENGGTSDENDAWLILDSAARLHGKNLTQALKGVHKVIVPILPSLFDMDATADFLDDLVKEKAIRKQKAFVAIVGMRVDARTQAAATLETFLGQFDLPVLTYLRDTQLYANAAFCGKSVFDLAPHLIEKDIEQWQPLLEWLRD